MVYRDPDLDWNDLPILLAIAREGSMTAASRRFGVDVSTISRRLAAAEAQLNTKLFLRDSSGYVPTEAGHAFLEHAETIEGLVRSLVSVTKAASEGVEGEVRITSVDVIFNYWLTPRLPLLLRKHPDLQLKLFDDNAVLSFTRTEADIALRVYRAREDAAIVMRRIGRFGIAVYGSPEFEGIPRERWTELPWLAFNDDLADVQEMEWLRQTVPNVKPKICSSSVPNLIKACESGAGVALMPCFAAAQSNLVRLSKAPEFSRDLWLLRHRDTAKLARFRVVAEWIASVMRADAELMSGEKY